MNRSELTDIQWRALLYYRDELSTAESEAFETELADDQSAREALAAAVQFCEVAKAAFEKDHVSPRKTTSRSIWATVGLISVVSAASILLIFGAQSAVHWLAPNTVASRDDSANVDGALVAAWAENATNWGGDAESKLSPTVTPEFENSEPEFDSLNDTPSWMLIAVESQGAQEMSEDNDSSSDSQ